MNYFEKDVLPCIDYFNNNENCDFLDINGDQTIEAVHAEIIKKVFNE